MTDGPYTTAAKQCMRLPEWTNTPALTLDLAFQRAYALLYQSLTLIRAQMEDVQLEDLLQAIQEQVAVSLQVDLHRLVGSVDYAAREAHPGDLE